MKKWRGQRQGRKEKFHHRVSRGAAEDAEKRRNGQRFNTEARRKGTQDPRAKSAHGAPSTEKPIEKRNPRTPPLRSSGRQEGLCHREILVEVAVEEGGNGADFEEQFGEFGGDYGLDAVGKGFVGLVMDFDEEAVGAGGYGGARHG